VIFSRAMLTADKPSRARQIGVRVLLCATVVCALSGRAWAAEPLRVVTDDYLGPSENVIDDDKPGFSIEVIRAVFAAMGRDVSFEGVPTNRAWRMIGRGEADAITSRSRTGEQETMCSVPDEPLIQDRWIFFVRTADIGKLKFSSFDDLIGHDVAVRGQVVVSPELWKFLREHHNMVETERLPDSLRLLAAGRVDYTLADLGFGTDAIARMGLSGKIAPLLSGNVIEGGTYLCFAKARVSPAFVNAFSRALREIQADRGVPGDKP